MNNYTKEKMLPTTQTSIVIPTGELIKNKKVDLRVLACVSAISNVDDWTKEGNNTRYCTIKRFNDNLNVIAGVVGIKRAKVVSLAKQIAEIGSDEFKITMKEYDDSKVSVLEMNYISGGFVTIDSELLQVLVTKLSKNAFKLYINLMWICRDSGEKAIKQEYLCEGIGLAKSSTKTIRNLENELENNNLLSTRVEWEATLEAGLQMSKPKKKKYYKLLSA